MKVRIWTANDPIAPDEYKRVILLVYGIVIKLAPFEFNDWYISSQYNIVPFSFFCVSVDYVYLILVPSGDAIIIRYIVKYSDFIKWAKEVC
jgi:hypothetical protein